jgi:hypothetical protein
MSKSVSESALRQGSPVHRAESNPILRSAEDRTPFHLGDDSKGGHFMRVRSGILAGLFVLGAGCSSGDTKPFPGTYAAEGQATGRSEGKAQVIYLTYTETITEGISSDLVLTDDLFGCAWPATVDGNVATVKAGATCMANLQQMGLLEPALLQVTNGMAIRTESGMQWVIAGLVNSTEPGQDKSGSFSLTMSLTKQPEP